MTSVILAAIAAVLILQKRGNGDNDPCAIRSTCCDAYPVQTKVHYPSCCQGNR